MATAGKIPIGAARIKSAILDEVVLSNARLRVQRPGHGHQAEQDAQDRRKHEPAAGPETKPGGQPLTEALHQSKYGVLHFVGTGEYGVLHL